VLDMRTDNDNDEDRPAYIQVKDVETTRREEGATKRVEVTATIYGQRPRKNEYRQQRLTYRFTRHVRRGEPLRLSSVIPKGSGRVAENEGRVAFKPMLRGYMVAEEAAREATGEFVEVETLGDYLPELLDAAEEAEANISGRIPKEDAEKYDEYVEGQGQGDA